MKKFYFLFLLVCVLGASKAQNWQTVYSDRVQYFDSGVNAIKIISKNINSNGDSIFYNYPAIYIDNNYLVANRRGGDSVSWIGKRQIISANGINYFVTGLNDTLRIKTQANDKESWEFLRNSNTLITAKVDSISFGVYNGIKDSVKHISLSVVANSSKYRLMVKDLDNKQIWLSKHNGLLRMPVIEYILQRGWNAHYRQAKEVYNQTKVNLFTNKTMFDFEVGDIVHTSFSSNFILSSPTHSNRLQFTLNEYTEKNYDSIGDSVQFKILVRFFDRIHNTQTNKYSVKHDTTYTRIKTYYNLKQQAFDIMPFSIDRFINVNFTPYALGMSTNEFTIAQNGACITPKISQQQLFTFEQDQSLSYAAKQGFNYSYLDGSNGSLPPNPDRISEGVIFSKNSCGEQGNDITLSINTISNESSIKVYPNPSKYILLVTGEKIKSIQITDLSGKTVYNKAFNNRKNSELINVSAFHNGIYMLRTEAAKGVYTNKVIVQH